MSSKMLSRLAVILMITQVHRVSNAPVNFHRSTRELHPLLISHPVVQQNFYGKKTILTPISVSQVYLHPKLQHIVTKDDYRFIGQTVHRNYTHPNLLPILIPIHTIVSTGNRLIPLHDLSVIPLQRNKIEKSQYVSRMADKNDDGDDSSNQYRNFYGGYGTGLFFGGHGSGHGFYAYGK